jgi:hypothetical protein
METLEELLRAWRDAEARRDVAALDELLAADFRGDGPLGFVLDKDGWLDQFRGGDLALEAFDWTVTEVRSTASTAVAVGIQTQTAQYLGQDCSGEFVCTLVAVRRSGHWTVTNLQLGKRSPRSLPARLSPRPPDSATSASHLCMTPQPWPRTGPGVAADGKPKFDLDRFDPAYFDRLRDRVIAAGNEGIYVAVMFFDGFGLHLSVLPDNVEGHPFHAANNINGIGITSIVDYQVLPLEPRVLALQEAYIQKVIDTVHDLPNVLYEVANESSGDDAEVVQFPDGSSIPTPIGDSTQWQYWVIDVVKQYEQQQGYDKHPIGMTMQYPVPDQSKVNDPLFDSPADWISPGFDDELFAESPEGRYLRPDGSRTRPPATAQRS